MYSRIAGAFGKHKYELSLREETILEFKFSARGNRSKNEGLPGYRFVAREVATFCHGQ